MKRILGLLSVIVMLAACQRPAVVKTVCTSSLPSDLAAIDTLMQTRFKVRFPFVRTLNQQANAAEKEDDNKRTIKH